MDIQALVDGLSLKWQKERAASQMTLGKLIRELEALPPETLIQGVEDPHSYRGYYSDLALEPMYERIPAGKLLAICRSAMGKVFEGYKGGDYVMGELTPLWLSTYGRCGLKIMWLGSDGKS